MLNPNPKQSTHRLGVILSVFVLVLLAHLTAIQAAVRGFLKVDASPSTRFITRLVEPTLQNASNPARVTPPKLQSEPKTESLKQKSNYPTVISNNEVQSEPNKLAEIAEISPSLEPQGHDATGFAPAIAASVAKSDKAAADTAQARSSEDAANLNLAASLFAAPPTARQMYEVAFTRNGNTNYGTAELDWQHDGGSYKLRLVASYFGIGVFDLQSQGLTSPSGLQPTRFSDKRYRKSEVATHFNYELGKITFSANKPEVPLLAGAQDRLSVILQLAGLLAAEPLRYTTGSSVTLQVANDKLAEPWVFAVENLEALNLDQGQTFAHKLSRNPRREFDQKVELWFDANRNFAPLGFRFTETNGDYVHARLKGMHNMLYAP